MVTAAIDTRHGLRSVALVACKRKMLTILYVMLGDQRLCQRTVCLRTCLLIAQAFPPSRPIAAIDFNQVQDLGGASRSFSNGFVS